MSGSEIDIVARLQLRAEQFSSETGQRFAELKTRAASSAQEIRREFGGAFAEVQKLAGTALQLPRNAAGSLDLSAEITQLRQAEAASNNHAQALRELSIAQTNAANAAQVDAQALRIEADAAAVGALAAERDAAAIRDRIVALEAVQTELNRTTSATRVNTGALEQAGVSAGQRRQALQQLGFQFNDVATQAASGTSAMVIFAQQSGQFIQAVQMMTGEARGFLGWLGSWQGALATALVIGLTPFIAKLFDGSTALEKESEKLRENAEKTAIAGQAKEAFARTAAGAIAQVDELTKAIERQNDALLTNAERLNIQAKNALENVSRNENDKALELKAARADLARLQAAPGFDDDGKWQRQFNAARARVQQLEAELANLSEKTRAAEAAVAKSRADLADDAAKRAGDKIEQIKRTYEGPDGLIEQAKRRAAAEGKVDAALTRQLTTLRAKMRAEIEAEEARRRAAQQATRDEAKRGNYERFSMPVDGRITSGMGGRSRPGGFGSANHRGIDIAVPIGTAVRAPALATVEVVGYDPGLGKYVVLNHGGGTKTRYGHLGTVSVSKGDRVEAGAAFARSGNTGRSTGPHLHYEVTEGGRTVDPRRGRFRTDAGAVADAAVRAQERGEKALARQEDAAERVAEQIARINAQWDDQPRLIDRAAADTRALEAIIKDNEGKADAVSRKIVADARAALQAVSEGLDRPMRDFLRSQAEVEAIQSLILEGRDVEARALQDALRIQQQMGPLSREQLDQVLRKAEAEERVSRALEAQRRTFSIYSGAASDFQRTFDRFLDEVEDRPGKAVANLGKGFVDSFRRLRNDLLSDQLFGGLEQDLQDYLRGRRADPANDELGRRTKTAGGHLEAFGDVVARVTARIDGAGVTGIGAKDPFAGMEPSIEGLGAWLLNQPMKLDVGGILESSPLFQGGDVKANTLALGNAADAFNFMGGRMVDRFESMFGKLPGDLGNTLRTNLGGILQGASNGMFGGSVFASITGGKQSALGSAIGGVLGKEAGKELAKGAFSFLGNAGGPLGSIAGGILGSVVGGLFSKTKKGSATLSIDNGAFGVGGVSGNSGSYRAAASGLAGNVGDALNQIAGALGGSVGGSVNVSIGKRKDDFVVDPSGRGRTKGAGTLKFASEEQAVRAAIADALSDGAIQGISDASRRILSSGQKLELAIEKASMIEAIPKQLMAMLDPVGAAIDELNTKWAKTLAALDEGGATAEQRADAEKLYRLQLEETKAATREASAELKDFLQSLGMGASSPLSLRDQESAAKTALQPFLDKIAGGERVDQAKYREAAQTYLDIERQLYGSTDRYFAAFEQIQAATAKAIETIDKAVPIRDAKPDPFAQATADNTAIANELLAQISESLRAIQNGAGGGGGADFGGFITEQRLFA